MDSRILYLTMQISILIHLMDNSFHSMSDIRCINLADVSDSVSPVPRVLNPPKAIVLCSFGPIKTYKKPMSSGLQHILVKDDLGEPCSEPKAFSASIMVDSLWIAGYALKMTHGNLGMVSCR